MLIHTGDKPYTCDTRGKYIFSKSPSVKIHMLIQIGAMPHSCKVCCKCFTKPSNLNRHNMLILPGNKPPICETYGKCLTLLMNLSILMLVHAGDIPHTCVTCCKYFTGVDH